MGTAVQRQYRIRAGLIFDALRTESREAETAYP